MVPQAKGVVTQNADFLTRVDVSYHLASELEEKQRVPAASSISCAK
jgi:hypothetical protein